MGKPWPVLILLTLLSTLIFNQRFGRNYFSTLAKFINYSKIIFKLPYEIISVGCLLLMELMELVELIEYLELIEHLELI